MLSQKRLRKEFVNLQREPTPLAKACPLDTNILEWRFLIQGIGVYEGGVYMGKLVFPPEYPLKPPSVLFITPSGRFAVNTRICLSISDFHPETWTPSWTVGTILTGIVSFFNGDDPTHGSIVASAAERQRLAASSMAFNIKDKMFVKLFGADGGVFPPIPSSVRPASDSVPASGAGGVSVVDEARVGVESGGEGPTVKADSTASTTTTTFTTITGPADTSSVVDSGVGEAELSSLRLAESS